MVSPSKILLHSFHNTAVLVRCSVCKLLSTLHSSHHCQSLFTMFVAFKSIYGKYLDALETEGRSIRGKLPLWTRTLSSEFICHCSCFIKAATSSSLCLASPHYISQPICCCLLTISVLPMHTLALYSHLFIHIKRFKLILK